MPLSPNPDDGPAPRRPKARAAEQLSFEAAYRELQQVVEQLESGELLDLEQAGHLFERGSQLVQTCERIVDEAQLRVTRLAAESASPLMDTPIER
jgi:exodeoxyribonuclease VII small subunit